MALSNEDLLKELSAKPIMEVVELVKMLEDEWGVSAAAPVAVAAAGAGGGEAAAEEKDEFDVVMTSFGEAKVAVIKAVRTITGLGLKEAKDAVEGTPSVIRSNLKKQAPQSSLSKKLGAVPSDAGSGRRSRHGQHCTMWPADFPWATS